MSASKPLSLIFIQPAATNASWREAMHYAADEHGDHNVVYNTTQMVGRALSRCINEKSLIGSLTFVSHGSPGAFLIGRDRVTANSLTPGHEFYKPEVHLPLLRLIPFFHPSATIEIQACNCADGKHLLVLLSKMWNRPVMGFTGEITFGRGVEYHDGRFIVCIETMCLTL